MMPRRSLFVLLLVSVGMCGCGVIEVRFADDKTKQVTVTDDPTDPLFCRGRENDGVTYRDKGWDFNCVEVHRSMTPYSGMEKNKKR